VDSRLFMRNMDISSTFAHSCQNAFFDFEK
jgi:hypothetical protein